MPIYEFQCKDCNAVFETLTTSAAADIKISCPQCQGERVKKLLSIGSLKRLDNSSAPAAAPSGCTPRRGFS